MGFLSYFILAICSLPVIVLIEALSPYTTYVVVTDTVTGKKGLRSESIVCTEHDPWLKNNWCQTPDCDFNQFVGYYSLKAYNYFRRWRYYIHCECNLIKNTVYSYKITSSQNPNFCAIKM